MHLRALRIENFRNLREVALEPHPRFNVLSGDNGQGKTNLLEAVYILATLRSFRTPRIDELIRIDRDVQGAEHAVTASLRARVERLGTERLLGVDMSKAEGKTARVDGKAARAVDYFGGVNAVLFAPDDLRLPKGPPSGRRRLLDRAVWNATPSFLPEAQTYERVLRSRNALLRQGQKESLKDSGAANPALLDVYDQQLAAAGAVLTVRRRAYLEWLEPLFVAAFERVSQSGLRAGLRYHVSGQLRRAALAAKPEATAPDAPAPTANRPSESAHDAQALLTQLQRDRPRDLARGFTHHGPHADDLEFQLNGEDAAPYASQGQLRALVLAFKIAEIRLLLARLSDTPVLLLDDVSSELDAARNQNLFDFLQEVPCQAFITTTSAAFIKLFDGRRDYRVQGGFIDAVG